MSPIRIVGLAILAIGIALLVFGVNASQSVGEQVVETFTGRFTERTTWQIIGGVAAIILGGALALFGARRA
jgi:hypothetical protein